VTPAGAAPFQPSADLSQVAAGRDVSFHQEVHYSVLPAPVESATGPAGPVRFRLPRVVASFTGRDAELAGLELALGRGGQAVITQTVTGLGGVGKTQLAAAYAHRHAERYQVVAWVRAEDGGIADLAGLAVHLHLPVDGRPPEEQASGALRWLESTDRPWLLILDNVADPAQLENLCPGSGPGQVLVTSRRRDFDQFGPVVTVGVFDEGTAVDYLVERTGRSKERAAAGRLAQALGRLPLALSHAAAYCAAGTSFDDYLRQLGALPAAELYDANPEAFYRQTVATTWQVSISAAESEAPLAVPVLAMAAYLAPDAIPISLFDTLVDGESARARRRLANGLAALHRYSLAVVTDASISVHRLLQKVVRDDAQARGDITGGLAALAALDGAFPIDNQLPASWPRCEQLLPHVLAIAGTLLSPAHAGQDLVQLLNRTTRYLLNAGGGERATAAAGTAVDAATDHLGPEHPHTLAALANLGASYRPAGRTAEAIAIEEQVVADSERVQGPEHPDTLTARANLATSYWSAGRTAEAIAIHEQVVADSERLLGPENPDTLIARANLAVSYWSAGRTAEAIAIHERVVADRERLLGPEHPDTLTARANLAASYWSAGRTAEAIAIEEQVVADSERLLGPEHPDTLTARANLAASYRSAGRTAEAMAIHEQVVADLERLLGPEHPHTLSARANLASSYWSAGRTAEAIAINEQVVADSERLLGPEHPDTLTARANLASSYRSAGRTAEAIAINEQVVADCGRLLGPEHPDTLTARANLAASYRSAGRTAEAEATEEHPS